MSNEYEYKKKYKYIKIKYDQPSSWPFQTVDCANP